ncbi:MAG TPA: dockerin type I domain-containing protein [Phycisphaerae bacterium]|nr:dockerin type I domain-containing protein [Phycisphaerae bacterium]HRW56060.1 dockerin type I domain-containing protein [Phycisphaerae bacterium]
MNDFRKQRHVECPSDGAPESELRTDRRAPAQRLRWRCVFAPSLAVCLAVTAAANADLSRGFGFGGTPGHIFESPFDASGTVNNVTIQVDFDNWDNFVYASDLLVAIVAPNGQGVEFGGEGGTLGYPSAGPFPSNWRSENNGVYSYGPINLSSYGLSGVGEYKLKLANGWPPSPGAFWEGTITIGGINEGLDSDGDGIQDWLDDCPNSPNVFNLTKGVYYPTIQAAMSDASSGDVIELGECTFFEDNLIFPTGVDMTIRGAGRALTIIDGGMGTADAGVFEMDGSGQTTASVVEDLTIQNDGRGAVGGGTGGAIFMRNSSLTLRRVDITGCEVVNSNSGTSALNVREGSVLDASECRFYENVNATCVLIYNGECNMRNCLVQHDSGLAVSWLSPNVMTNCTIVGNISTRNGAMQTLNNCIITGSRSAGQGGSYEYHHSMFSGATGDNIDGAPVFVDAANDDYRLAPGSPGIDAADYDAYTSAGGGATDLMNVARTFDACMEDSGVGAISFLDIGAYETQTDGPDSDGDGLSDECDICPNRVGGDVSGDGAFNIMDAAPLAEILANPNAATADDLCAADFNRDGTVDGRDLQIFINWLLAS